MKPASRDIQTTAQIHRPLVVAEKPGKLPPSRLRLNAHESAAYVGLTDRTFKKYRQERRIPFYRLGHVNVVCDVRDLDSWLAARRVEAI